MRTKTAKKTKPNAPISRKPSGMIDEKGKSIIVEEVKSDGISYLGAGRNIGLKK
jgi:hypothetical protein